MRSRSFLFIAALSAAQLAPTPSFASPAEVRAAADALFQEGRALVKQGQLAAGCAKLEASEKLDPAPGTLLALADCFERDGRLASAWSTWNDAATLSRQRNDKRRLETAEKRALALEPKLPKLEIDVPPESAVDGLVVKRNESPVEAAIFGFKVPVDPGEQAISATAPGREPWTTTVVIKAEPGVTNVRIPPLVKLPEPDVTAPPAPKLVDKPKPVEPKLQPKSNTQRTVGLVIVGLGVTGLLAGSTFGALTFSSVSQAEGLCGTGRPPRCSQRGLDLYRWADTTATVSDIAFGVGGAALVTGIVVVALSTSQKPHVKTALQASPWVGPGTVGALLGGEF